MQVLHFTDIVIGTDFHISKVVT